MGMVSLYGIRFLVIDDNRYMRNLLRGILGSFGAKDVQEAGDGADGFKVLRSFTPDVVLTDNLMSPLDGIEFTHMLRIGRDSPLPMVPIIMITGFTDMYHVTAARDAGINEFLAKPVSAHALYSRIHSVLTRPRPFVKAPGYFGPCRRRRAERRAGTLDTERRRTPPTLIDCEPRLLAEAS